ncbi:378_t:CDS:1 [Gigaspora margarita]|uniref:378_t:CDS:1 n=1 Tax=Gigaspora margarita TaxID=4874 RepID=A0ABN7W1P9_GIGMA|nr:378_t:CDS:1 [Gigaspora margarita]
MTFHTYAMDVLDQLTDKSRKKIFNPKTNHMIIINGSAYNKLLREGYMHWKEEGLLIPPSNEMPILREYLSFISNVIAYDPEKSLLMLINGKVSLLQILLKVYNDSATNQLLKIDWNSKKTQEWRSNILIKFLHHPNLAPSKHRPGALYDAFTEANVLGPKHILALARAIY